MISKIIKYGSIAGAIYFFSKLYTNNEALKSITSRIVKIKNVQINLERIQLTLDILLTNLSKNHLGINNNVLSIQQIQFYNRRDGVLIGVADANVTGIEIPAGQSYNLNDVVVTIDQPFNNILSLYDLFTGNLSEKLKVVLIFTSLGKSYRVDSEMFA